jgi:hypothetical protein
MKSNSLSSTAPYQGSADLGIYILNWFLLSHFMINIDSKCSTKWSEHLNE